MFHSTSTPEWRFDRAAADLTSPREFADARELETWHELSVPSFGYMVPMSTAAMSGTAGLLYAADPAAEARRTVTSLNAVIDPLSSTVVPPGWAESPMVSPVSTGATIPGWMRGVRPSSDMHEGIDSYQYDTIVESIVTLSRQHVEAGKSQFWGFVQELDAQLDAQVDSLVVLHGAIHVDLPVRDIVYATDAAFVGRPLVQRRGMHRILAKLARLYGDTSRRLALDYRVLSTRRMRRAWRSVICQFRDARAATPIEALSRLLRDRLFGAVADQLIVAYAEVSLVVRVMNYTRERLRSFAFWIGNPPPSDVEVSPVSRRHRSRHGIRLYEVGDETFWGCTSRRSLPPGVFRARAQARGARGPVSNESAPLRARSARRRDHRPRGRVARYSRAPRDSRIQEVVCHVFVGAAIWGV